MAYTSPSAALAYCVAVTVAVKSAEATESAGGTGHFQIRILAGAEGFEPPTYGFGDRRSSS